MPANSTELLVLLFDDVTKADKALEELKELARYKYLKIVDAAVLTRDGEGKATLKETNDFSGKKGAIVGAVGGALVAVLMGPVGWVAGAAVGAGIGGVGAHLGDRGLPNDELEDLKAQLVPNSSALIVQVEHEWAGTLKESFETRPVAASGRQITLSEQFRSAARGMESDEVVESDETIAPIQPAIATMQPGTPFPLGATPIDGGVNFSVYANHADAIELLLFDRVDAAPVQVIRLDPAHHRTYHYWHAWVPGLQPGQIYAYRALGPDAPERGLRYDAEKALLDPYGRAVAMPATYNRAAASQPGDNADTAMKSVVVDPDAYDWEGDQPLRRPFAETVVYELHVAGFTRHPNSGVAPAKRGSYAGLIEKIPYLKDLGITAVELLPVFHFDPTTAAPGLVNYWGYQPISFFAPYTGYSSRPDPLGALDEFRDMVKALHRAGIEVILDVVYNHTAEAYGEGATLCFRGLANDTYYILDEQDRSRYVDYSGCFNTLNAGQAVVRRMIVDSLRYWAQELHVDGFRFDLASVLTRGEGGTPLPNPPVIWEIETDPVLAGVKLIAEAWDAAGLYQVGSFVGDFWKEWNGRFRDDIRSFVKSDNGFVRALANRLAGSPDVYGRANLAPEKSINFLAVHDGFTLNDVFSYNAKHNEANGEDNTDGGDDNRSWNCGVEGPTDDPEIEALRNRQVKNCLALLLLAVGNPLFQMGDEVRRTQGGNNNAYCQDNEISWFDWSLVEKHADVHRFVKLLIAGRLGAGSGRSDTDQLMELLSRVQMEVLGVSAGPADAGDTSHALALSRTTADGTVRAHLMVNAYWEPLTFTLPPADTAHGWRRWIDTSLPAPEDINTGADAPAVPGSEYQVGPRSVAALIALTEAPVP